MTSEKLLELINHSFINNLIVLLASQVVIKLSRIITIVFLSRYLTAIDYGSVAIILTVYEIICVFTKNGISQTVVHASNENVHKIANTAWTLTWIICIILTITQFLVAQPLAILLGNKDLALPIAVMGVIYLVNPYCNIQSAFISREGRIKIIAGAVTLQVIADNILSAFFAIMGMGLWAVILPKLLVAPIWLFINRANHPWRPTQLTLKGSVELIKYSRGYIGSEILTVIQCNIDNIFVSVFFGLQALGLYYFAFNAGIGITMGVVGAFSMAVFPWLCAVNNDRNKLIHRYHVVLLSVVGFTVFLVILQTTLAWFYVPIIYSEKWIPAIPILVIICLSAIPRAFSAMATQLLRSMGKTGQDFKWQLIFTSTLVTGLCLAVNISLESVAWVVLISQIIVTIPFSIQVYRKLHSY